MGDATRGEPREGSVDMAELGDRARRWLERLNRSDHVLVLLFVASFLETIVVPIPIELILVPFMLANPHRLWRSAGAVTLGCLAASVLGYGIGFFLFESAGEWAIRHLGWQSGYRQFQQLFEAHGFWAILALGIVPVPFQTAMLAAGTAGYPLPLFVLAATIARGIRYFGLALLVHLFGERARVYWESNRWATFLAVAAAIAAAWGLVRWLGSRMV